MSVLGGKKGGEDGQERKTVQQRVDHPDTGRGAAMDGGIPDRLQLAAAAPCAGELDAGRICPPGGAGGKSGNGISLVNDESKPTGLSREVFQ